MKEFEKVPKENEQEQEPKQELIWSIYEPETGIEELRVLEENLNSNDINSLYEQVGNQQLLRTLIVYRGQDKQFIRQGLQAIQRLLLYESSDPLELSQLNRETLLYRLDDLELPFNLLCSLSQIAYHLDDKMLLDLVMNATQEQNNPYIQAEVNHNFAAWNHTKEKNNVAAVDLNKDVIGQARDLDDKILELKALAGIKIQRTNISPIDKADDLIEIADQMFKLGHVYDAIRIQEEVAQTKLSIIEFHIKRNNPDDISIAEELLEEVHQLALDSFVKGRDMHYPIAQIKAARVLSKLFEIKNTITPHKNNRRRMRRFANIAQKLKQEFAYLL